MIQVIHGEIWGEDFTELDQLIRDFQSCVRFSYCRFDKDKMVFNDVRKAAKVKYQMLNTRQVSDAVVQGQALKTRHKDKKIIFGGRKSWEDLKSGTITKDEWLRRRDSQIYCRGDKTQKGNLNIRIMDDDTLRITIGTRKWASFKLFVPDKYQQELKTVLASGQAYNVRLKRKDDQHFKVMIDYQIEPPVAFVGFQNGAVIRTLEGKYDGKRIHSWRLWKALNDNVEAVLTGLQVRLADLKEFVGNIWYRGEKLRGEVFLQELLAGSKV